ncbi:MAG: DUF1788 domain-containing protein [Thermoleophilia bacterium]|nr:DUF1788 domain-containing protein [Thermoleophilia bacterium]
MSSLNRAFEELIDRIREPGALNPARSDPIFYFVYPPDQALTAKRALLRWGSKLRTAGYQVIRVSLSRLMWDLIDASGRWETWLQLEAGADLEQLNEAVRDVLRQGDAFVKRVAEAIETAPDNAVVLLTESELLHPYFRTRTIESKLHDKVKKPVVLFYPGRRSGQYGLQFLDFYTVDGNYRSTLIGGL